MITFIMSPWENLRGNSLTRNDSTILVQENSMGVVDKLQPLQSGTMSGPPLGLKKRAGIPANIYANRAPQTIVLQVSEERQRLTRFKHYILPFSGRQQYQ